MSSKHKQLIPLLDMFRLVAALLVVLVHYEIIFGQFVIYGSFSTTALSWFFVLSGFIIAYNYPALGSASEILSFYKHRLIRIYPVYALAVLISALFVSAGYLSQGDVFFSEVRRPFEISYDLPEQKDIWFWLSTTVRHLTFTQSISGIETLKLVFDGPLWSLVLEMYFYLAFPLLLYVVRPFNSLPRIVAALLGAYLLQFILIQLFLPEAEFYNVMNLNVPVYTNPLIRGLEFVFGMLLYKAFVLLPDVSGKASGRLWVLGLGMVAFVVFNIVGEKFIPYQYSMYFFQLPAVVWLVWLMSRFPWYPQHAVRRFCLWCGGMSYVVYCFHWPVMEMVQYWDIVPPAVSFPLHLLLVLLLLFIFSHLVLRVFETPVRRALYRRFDPEKQKVF